MSQPRPVLDPRARAALDAIELPLSVASAIRDRDGRLLDFRLDHVNDAAARWAGLSAETLVGRLVTELIPAMRPAGLFDALEGVVATGAPFRQRGAHYEGHVADGNAFSAAFELMAVRLGDGYLSAWSEHPGEGPGGRRPADLAVALDRALEAVSMLRPEARAESIGWVSAGANRVAPLRLRPA